ncbi:APC family permease [Burkholderia orbicola]|uniref:APC family permease n=1 Tax=Burkholderia orbicola TaxID=2978683 RepID=UPI002655B25A|nr:APC family permease [Burkholderia orbicola]MDN7779612.1 APC family permease [Burkholderia orbicola]MDN7990151.1 APC family permease [Burkholderia orbicola]
MKTSGYRAIAEKGNKLTGNMGAFGLALSVLAFSAPLTTVSGYVPVALMYGGAASPTIFIATMVLLMLFSLGYLTLNHAAKRPGDFYAFITHGLGKSAGLGAGLLATITYFIILAGVPAYFGVASADLQRTLTGWAFPWYYFTLACWLAIAIFGYLHIEVSAKFLTWVMVAEVIVCVAFCAGVIGSNPSSDLPPNAIFSPSGLFNTNSPFAMLFAVSFFMGFEATALFRDEVRDPDRTIPRATYGAVIFIGLLYTFCAYALIRVYGHDVISVATQSPATMFQNAFDKFVSARMRTPVAILVLTSAFASSLSIHNVLTRYLHNLGIDGAFPQYLSAIHPKHLSPHRSSITVSTLTLLVLLPFIVTGAQPELLYGRLSGVGTAGGLILMTVVNVSCLVWYFREGRFIGAGVFKACVAPGISAVLFVALVVLVGKHFELLVGGEPGQSTWMLYSLCAVQIFGMALAVYFRKAKPEVFRRLGRNPDVEPRDGGTDDEAVLAVIQ